MTENHEKHEERADVPLVGQRPQFPSMNVQVTPHGLVITTQLTPLSAITQVLDIETLKKILPQLKDILKQNQDQALFIQRVQQSRND